jgi:RimJ/RimL family protein N-acetyltransferase
MEYVRLKSGREVAIRAIRHDDGARLEASHALLSPDTRYRRFLAAKPRLTPGELRYLTHVDGRDHVALIATPADDPERIIGVGRFIRAPADRTTAEFAIVIGDAYQGDGLATQMLEMLASEATERGIMRFTATVLADNEPVRRLLRGLTGQFAHQARNGPVEELTVELAA